MKDFQFTGKSAVIAAGTRGMLRLDTNEVAFMDKKFVAVDGIGLAKISVLVGLGKVALDMTDFSTYVHTSSTTHIIEIPMPTNNITVSVDNSAGGVDVNIMYYGGSA